MVFPTLRAERYEKDTSDAQLHENLDLLEERRTEAHLRELTYKKAIARLYNIKVRPQQVTTSDLVLRKAEESDPTRTRGKLAPTWEGPYRVIKMVRKGTCIFANQDDKQLPRTWHISNLRKFYA
ncbi:hypothetical protein BHE74_00036321 [Ensete ventricosum]|uniref:Uncharacterized protein n=1 Tax=Ensete ventricosum TaxID=4639 RepID=A0A445MKB6_ENSVE|nr:hypothetical protein BHE74_00036321 [Ensete ventricosum]RZR74685.1 hypothetical protein BHM03_00041292 [Ensete ventricosum]